MVASCKDDSELIAKSEKQKEEITRLRHEITLVETRLRNIPEDKSDDVAAAEAKLKQLTFETNKVDSEITELQREKDSLDQELAEFKKKYPTK